MKISKTNEWDAALHKALTSIMEWTGDQHGMPQDANARGEWYARRLLQIRNVAVTALQKVHPEAKTSEELQQAALLWSEQKRPDQPQEMTASEILEALSRYSKMKPAEAFEAMGKELPPEMAKLAVDVVFPRIEHQAQEITKPRRTPGGLGM